MVGRLHRCEALAAQLIAEQGQLAYATMQAETAYGLSAVSTQAVLGEFAEAAHRASRVRAHLVTGHRRLEVLGRQLGIDVSLYGDTGKTPGGPDVFTTGADSAQVVS